MIVIPIDVIFPYTVNADFYAFDLGGMTCVLTFLFVVGVGCGVYGSECHRHPTG